MTRPVHLVARFVTRVVAIVVLLATIAGCIYPDHLPRSLSARDRARVYEAIHVHQHAIKLYAQGDLPASTAVAQRSLELMRDALGGAHVIVAVPLHTLAVLHQTQGAYAQAESLYLEVITILDQKLGVNGFELTRVLHELAGLYMQRGAYDKAEPLYARALASRQRGRGSNHPEVLESLNGLARSLEKQGAYSRAEPLYAQALAIAEQELGPHHRDVARGLNGLGMLYWTQGDYARAEPLLVRSLRIRQNLLAEVTRFGPSNIHKIENAFTSLMYQRSSSAASDSESKSGPRARVKVDANRLTHIGALTAYRNVILMLNSAAVEGLSNIDDLYSISSPNAEAEPLLAGTADVFDTVLETIQTDVAQGLDSLARLYVSTGEYRRAEPLLGRTLEDREKRLGASHPELANSLTNLAHLYQTQGAYAQAEPLLRRALAVRERGLGGTHPDVARSLNNLTLLYMMQGAYEKAEPLMVRTAMILEKKLGGTHPDVARSLNNLASLYHEQGAYERAAVLYRRAVDIASKAPGGPHPDAARYLNNLAMLHHASGAHAQAEPLLAWAVELRDAQVQVELARLPAARKRALTALLQRETEGLVSLHAESAPASARTFELALTAVLRRKGLALASLIDNHAALRANPTAEIRGQLDQLEKASAELSALLHAPAEPRYAGARAAAIASLRARSEGLELSLHTASVALRARSKPVTPAMIQAALPAGAALIELVRYRRFDPRRGHQRWQEARYVAYVLQRQGAPQWASLGEAAPIEAAVDAVLAEMHRSPGADATRAALQRLEALVLAPLRGRLAGVSHLIIAPDGKLNLVPFEALAAPDGRYELEHRLVSYVTSGRELLANAGRQAPRSPAAVVAAPDYGPGRLFAHLAEASGEGAEVAAHFTEPRMLTGNGATKAALAAITGPAVLHVATHGFFARSPSARGAAATRGAWLEDGEPLERDMFVEGASASLALDEPSEALDHAGLALAGANVRADGIVTAREIASYDWWGARLVVLSACATGVGVAPSGEGIYGLRLALSMAGAESQIVSLWNVSDSSARALMRELYRELARGAGRAEALRRAKLRLLKQPRFAHPYYWAAFIPAGHWGPLDPPTQIRPRRGS